MLSVIRWIFTHCPHRDRLLTQPNLCGFELTLKKRYFNWNTAGELLGYIKNKSQFIESFSRRFIDILKPNALPFLDSFYRSGTSDKRALYRWEARVVRLADKLDAPNWDVWVLGKLLKSWQVFQSYKFKYRAREWSVYFWSRSSQNTNLPVVGSISIRFELPEFGVNLDWCRVYSIEETPQYAKFFGWETGYFLIGWRAIINTPSCCFNLGFLRSKFGMLETIENTAIEKFHRHKP